MLMFRPPSAEPPSHYHFTNTGSSSAAVLCRRPACHEQFEYKTKQLVLRSVSAHLAIVSHPQSQQPPFKECRAIGIRKFLRFCVYTVPMEDLLGQLSGACIIICFWFFQNLSHSLRLRLIIFLWRKSFNPKPNMAQIDSIFQSRVTHQLI
jgi:hypothetical protein